jgi:hypothetical protein
MQHSCCAYLYTYDVTTGATAQVGLIGTGGTGTGTAWGSIAAPATPNTFALSAPTYSGAEGGEVTVTVTRGGPLRGAATIDYSTADGSAGANSDYVPRTGTLSFAAGQQTATVQIPLVDDARVEDPETFSFKLLNPRGGAASIDGPDTATVTVVSNDQPGGGGGDTTPPGLALSAPKSTTLTAFLKGLKATATPTEPVTLAFELLAKPASLRIASVGDVVLAEKALPLAAGARSATLKPSRKLIGTAKRAFKVRVRVTATDAGGNRTQSTATTTVKPPKKKR